jgi:NCAIR mutase (PurE)-related protein
VATRRTAGIRRRPPEIRVAGIARFDVRRSARTGAPEIILGEGKTPAHLLVLLRGLQRRGVGAFVSRPTPLQRRLLERASVRDGLRISVLADGRLLRLAGPLAHRRCSGTVALVTAGTADVPVAEEARALLDALGVRTATAHDVGVAGLHRLLRAVRTLEKESPAVYLAFAGREGALPTVLAGLVRAPVIGIPTSVGYGRGGRGEGALTAMLQSCAPIAVVNVDAAVPAALFALQLLAGAHRARGKTAG